MSDVVKTLNQISTVPLEDEKFNTWLEMRSAITFLQENDEQPEFVVYASTRFTFIHAILVPASSVKPPVIDDLMSWNCNPTSSWAVTVTFSDPCSVSLAPPLDHTGSQTLNSGEQLVFARYFEGRSGQKNYYEILQKFVHLFGLHFVEEKNAYCRLDKHGDVEEVIRIIEIPGKGEDFNTTIVTFARAVLDEYLVLTDSVIVRTFDFTRYRPNFFGGWNDIPDTSYDNNGEIFYRLSIEPGYASFMRGFQLLYPHITKELLIKRFSGVVEEEKQYVSFIAHDWKNDVVREISCAPGHTANYFTKSDLPFEVSPAFFKPEVLVKYKADSDKYSLSARSISCRSAWTLKTYDINDAGQAHTYLAYLRDLPYQEQLYWKSYNEKPKGPISKRAIKTDFEGTWDLEYDPLSSLKGILQELNRQQVPWWTLRSKSLPDQVHYPVTPSPDEWSNEILQLDQLIVEGLETKWLRSRAELLGRSPAPAFGSLKLVEEYLISLGFAEEDALNTISPLRKLHDLRSKLKGHASGKDASTIRKQILKDHGNYKNHFHVLCETCDESIRAIAKTFKPLL